MNGRSLRPSTVPTGSRRNDRRRLTFVQLTTSPTATRTPTLPVEGKHSRDPRKFYSAREALSVAKPPIFVLRSVAATRAGTRLFRMLGFARRNNDRHASVACWGWLSRSVQLLGARIRGNQPDRERKGFRSATKMPIGLVRSTMAATFTAAGRATISLTLWPAI